MMSTVSPNDLHLTKLPPEILQSILSWLNPASFVHVSLISRLFRDLTRDNRQLFRDVYLLHFDTPPIDEDLDWRKEVYDYVKLEAILAARKDPKRQIKQVPFISDTVCRLLSHAACSADGEGSSRNVEKLREIFSDEATVDSILQQSTLFSRMREMGTHCEYQPQPNSDERHQQSAKLHVHYGKPILKSGRLRSDRTYPFACSKVYDLREYTQRTRWGPFRDDGSDRVDWEKLEAICIVLRKNLALSVARSEIFSSIWDTPFAGSFPKSFIPKTIGEVTELDKRDPYGVSGSWYRVVCFLDYSDFFHFNFSMEDGADGDRPRGPLNVGEATRILIMKIHVTSIEDPGPDDGQALPVVHFEGESRSLDDPFDENANSDLRGSVRLTKEGEVRWTTTSVFNGQERWKSEGVQVGGVGSARGVIGNWFDRDYDVHGPAGPTAFWKAADGDNPQRALVERGLADLPGFQFEAHFLPGDGHFAGNSDDDEDEDFDEQLTQDELQELLQEELPHLLAEAGVDLVEMLQHTNHIGGA